MILPPCAVPIQAPPLGRGAAALRNGEAVGGAFPTPLRGSGPAPEIRWTANSKPIQGRRLLDKLDDDAQAWLTMALDPFHDYSYNVAGLPDDRCQASVVRCQKNLKTITKPAYIASELWDCYIVSLPFGGSFSANNCEVNSTGAHFTVKGAVPDSAVGSFSTITVICVPSGTPWYGVGTDPNAYDDTIIINAMDSIDPAVPARFIGGGYEVTNVTPELYKGGTYTYFDNGSDHDIISAVASPDNGGTWGGVNTKLYRGPPPNASVAAKHPSSVTWNASEGCYARIPLVLDDMAYRVDVAGQLWAFLPPSGSTSLALQPAALFNGVAGSQKYRTIGTGCTVSCFTGLSAQTSLTLTSRLFVETAPTILSDELALASPSASFDSQVLELYRNTACNLPGAVPVGMNPKGEFWGMVVKAIGMAGSALVPLVSSIPVYGAALGPGLGIASTVLQKQGQKMVEKAQAKPKKSTVRANAAPKATKKK